MSYTISYGGGSTHSAVCPPGSIMSYLGINSPNGDPDGWVVCDGVTRTVTDGRFINVYNLLNTALGVNTNTENSITPPNLLSAFLCGPNGSVNGKITSGGFTDVTLTADNMPQHSHTINIYDPGHNHSIYQGNTQSGSPTSYWGYPDVHTYLPPNQLSGEGFYPGYTNISATSDAVGSGQSFQILPPYVGMSYIMKY